MDLVQPKPNEVFVDLDNEAAQCGFAARWNDFVRVYPNATVQYTTSKSGNLHAYVTVPELDPLTMPERIAMQAALGSDPLREMIALNHHRGGYEYASVFFEVKGTIRRDTPSDIDTLIEAGAK
jgi:hypothetical protein